MTMAGKEGISRGDAEAVLDLYGLDALCDAIVEGETQARICQALGVTKGSLGRWISLDKERERRVREARIAAAEAFEEMAEEELANAKTPFELAKAKERGYHWRWRASKADPRRYGDKVAVGGAEDLPPIESKSTLDVSGLSDEQLRALASIAVQRS